MSIGDKTLKKKDLKPSKVRQTSSPAKVFQSRASKPSGVSAIADTATATLQEVGDKLNELLEALKK
jgi:hypothetical protein